LRIRQIITEEKGLSAADIVASISFACNLTKEQVFCNMDSDIDERTLLVVRRCLDERMAGKPLAYITGAREFFSENFFVNKDVLIPRPETEVLVEEALKIIDKKKDRAVLDMGTGSGAIGITMAKHSASRVVCADISPAALRVARKNADAMGVSQRTLLVCCDLFDGISRAAKFDMIVANLPYIAAHEWDTLMADVRQYEPKGALWGGEDGMDTYRRFVPGLTGHLRRGGHVLVEIGSSTQAKKVGAMLAGAGLTVNIKKDYSGRERVLVGHG